MENNINNMNNKGICGMNHTMNHTMNNLNNLNLNNLANDTLIAHIVGININGVYYDKKTAKFLSL